jgi:hypothetical protein
MADVVAPLQGHARTVRQGITRRLSEALGARRVLAGNLLLLAGQQNAICVRKAHTKTKVLPLLACPVITLAPVANTTQSVAALKQENAKTANLGNTKVKAQALLATLVYRAVSATAQGLHRVRHVMAFRSFRTQRMRLDVRL